MAETKKKKKDEEEIPTVMTTPLMASICSKFIDAKNLQYRIKLKEKLSLEEEER